MSATDDRLDRIMEAIGEVTTRQVAGLLDGLTDAEKLALCRALVADLPGVVVAKVPDAWFAPAEKNTPYNKGRRRGWNDFRTAIITAGSATPSQLREDGT